MLPYCRYSHKNLSFGIVDIGIFPNAAEKFGIYLGGKISLARKLFNYFQFHHIHVSLVILRYRMGIMNLQGAWINFLHISYLRMQLRFHAFHSWIRKQNLLLP